MEVSVAGTASPLDADVTPGFLATSYALYRTMRGGLHEAIVFEGMDGYCAGRAKQLGVCFESTAIVVRCDKPLLREALFEGPAFLSKGLLGRAMSERLAVELADAVVCADPEALVWMSNDGWKLPEQQLRSVHELGPTASLERSAPDESKLVSVVVTFHERTEYLRFCLEGLARQTYPALEVVLVDDGSMSPAAAGLLGEVESESWPWPLRVLRLPAGGVAAARNAGREAASGSLIVFVDDDDVPFDDLVAYLVRGRNASRADVVTAGARLFRGKGAPTPREQDVVRIPLGEPRELGLLSNHFGAQTCIWSRDLLKHLGGFASVTDIAEDWDLLVRAAVDGARIVGTPDPLWWFRQTPGGRYSANPLARRDATVASVGAVAGDRLPAGFRLLPRLAAGAYDELEKRARAATPRRTLLLARGQLLAARARQVRAEQGTTAVLQRAVRLVRGRR